MPNINEFTSVETPNAAVVGAATNDSRIERSTVVSGTTKVTARQWFALGDRVPYDRRARKILRSSVWATMASMSGYCPADTLGLRSTRSFWPRLFRTVGPR